MASGISVVVKALDIKCMHVDRVEYVYRTMPFGRSSADQLSPGYYEMWHTIENDGKVNQYYIENDHEPIIDRDEWEAVQLDLAQREAFKRKHGIRELGSSTLNPFTAKVYCGKCGGKYMRKYWKGIRSVFWKCENADKKRGKTCAEPNIPEERLRNAIVVAWNSIVENRNNSTRAVEKHP